MLIIPSIFSLDSVEYWNQNNTDAIISMCSESDAVKNDTNAIINTGSKKVMGKKQECNTELCMKRAISCYPGQNKYRNSQISANSPPPSLSCNKKGVHSRYITTLYKDTDRLPICFLFGTFHTTHCSQQGFKKVMESETTQTQ